MSRTALPLRNRSSMTSCGWPVRIWRPGGSSAVVHSECSARNDQLLSATFRFPFVCQKDTVHLVLNDIWNTDTNR